MRLLAAIALCAVTGCISDPEIGDPHVEAVCIYDAHLSFRGSRTGATDSNLDLGGLDVDLGLASGRRVTLDSATLTAADGIADLGFAERVRVRVIPTDQEPLAISETSVAAGARDVFLAGNPDIDLAGYIVDDSDVGIEVTGDTPASQWSATLDLCFDIE